MPKETFYNLPAAKRNLIEAAAIDEFAAWGFDNASINRVVAAAQIAKGSFYQYFEDKQDLFHHVIVQISEQKRAYLSPLLQNLAEQDLFTLLAELYRSGLAFGRDHPEAARVGNLIYRHREHPVYKEILASGMDSAQTLFESLLQAAIDRGDIRPDINLRFVGHLLSSLTPVIFDFYFSEVRGMAFDVADIDDDVMETVSQTLDLLKNGLALPAKELA